MRAICPGSQHTLEPKGGFSSWSSRSASFVTNGNRARSREPRASRATPATRQRSTVQGLRLPRVVESGPSASPTARLAGLRFQRLLGRPVGRSSAGGSSAEPVASGSVRGQAPLTARPPGVTHRLSDVLDDLVRAACRRRTPSRPRAPRERRCPRAGSSRRPRRIASPSSRRWLEQPREDRHMRPREHADADHVDVLVERRLRATSAGDGASPCRRPPCRRRGGRRATTLTPRSWPSRPTFASRTRIGWGPGPCARPPSAPSRDGALEHHGLDV